MKILIALILIVFLYSCSKSGSGGTPPAVDPCIGTSFRFSSDVQPIFTSTCSNSSNCHGTASTNVCGPLTDYNKIFTKRAIISSQVRAGIMPQNSTLSADQKNKIICWINSGAPNN